MIVASLYIITNLLFISAVIVLFLMVFNAQKKKKQQRGVPIKVDIVIPCKDDNENLYRLLNELLSLKSPHLSTITVIDDGSSLPIKVPDGIQLERYEESRGKTLALKKGVKSTTEEWVLFIDADIENCKKSIQQLPEILSHTQRGIVALPFGERFQHTLRPLQFEEAALKLLTQASALRNSPLLLSSAFLLMKRDLAIESLNVHQHPYGWDMFILKKHTHAIEYVMPEPQISATTSGKKNYLGYVKQRSRWITNGFKFNPIGLTLVGVLVLGVYTFDYLAFYQFFFIQPQEMILLSSIFFIKACSIYYLSKKWLKSFNINIQPHHFAVGQLLYGLNITIILIFLVLQRVHTIRK